MSLLFTPEECHRWPCHRPGLLGACRDSRAIPTSLQGKEGRGAASRCRRPSSSPSISTRRLESSRAHLGRAASRPHERAAPTQGHAQQSPGRSATAAAGDRGSWCPGAATRRRAAKPTWFGVHILLIVCHAASVGAISRSCPHRSPSTVPFGWAPRRRRQLNQ